MLGKGEALAGGDIRGLMAEAEANDFHYSVPAGLMKLRPQSVARVTENAATESWATRRGVTRRHLSAWRMPP